MHKHIVLFLGLLACPVLAGCGSSSSNFSCDDPATMLTSGSVTTAHLCVEYDDIPSGSLASEQTSCTTQMSTTGTSCSTTNLLGTCTVVAGGFTSHVAYYSDVGGVTVDPNQTQRTPQQPGNPHRG
jgi:hypothetical protein